MLYYGSPGWLKQYNLLVCLPAITLCSLINLVTDSPVTQAINLNTQQSWPLSSHLYHLTTWFRFFLSLVILRCSHLPLVWSLCAVCLPTSHPSFLLGQHNLSSVSPAVGPAPADDSWLTTGNVTFLSFLVAWSSLVTWSGQWDMTKSVGELLSRVFLTNQWDIFPHPHLSEGEHMSGAQQPLCGQWRHCHDICWFLDLEHLSLFVCLANFYSFFL